MCVDVLLTVDYRRHRKRKKEWIHNMPLGRKIRYGMVGGGPDAFIGAVHRKAAALDGEIELVAGAFSSSPEKSKQQGAELFLDDSRTYGSYKEMAEKESQLPEGERIDFVSIVTPKSRAL